MPAVNRYVDISQVEKEAKKDYIDRHSPFVHCANEAKKGEKFCVKVKMGNEYKHPDEAEHFIAWVQLWNGEYMVAQASFSPFAQGAAPSNVEVDFYIVPTKNMKLTAMSFCTKHGLWESDPVEVSVAE